MPFDFDHETFDVIAYVAMGLGIMHKEEMI